MWYYSQNGSQLGPLDLDALKAKLQSGEVSGADLVWTDGMTDWLPAAQVPQLQISAAIPSSGHPAQAAPYSQPSVSPYSPPQASPYGAPMQPYNGPEIPTNLWQSIVVTLICCLPFGIVAIVYASKVDGLKARGDYAGAAEASKKAQTWISASIITSLVLVALNILGRAALHR